MISSGVKNFLESFPPSALYVDKLYELARSAMRLASDEPDLAAPFTLIGSDSPVLRASGIVCRHQGRAQKTTEKHEKSSVRRSTTHALSPAASPIQLQA